jgi:hypothetical protein
VTITDLGRRSRKWHWDSVAQFQKFRISEFQGFTTADAPPFDGVAES